MGGYTERERDIEGGASKVVGKTLENCQKTVTDTVAGQIFRYG